MIEKQKTIAKAVILRGKGLHSGAEVELTIKPAVPNHGFKFKRIDLDNQAIINALASNVVNTARGTTLEENGASVMTIEHLCAALSGMDVDNALIELTGPEVPILDGSAKPFVDAIASVGVIEQEAERIYYEIKEKISYTDEYGVDIVIYPDNKFSVDVHIDYNSKVLGNQFASLRDIADFQNEIATCKTFVFLHELEALAKNNLIKGGDLDNALIIIDNAMSQDELDRLAELFNKPKVHVRPEGILNNTHLHFQNEPARHKLLDVVGDLSLIGTRIKGKVIARKPGHHGNTELAKIIQEMVEKDLATPIAPVYDPKAKPVYDINEVEKILPHSSPFLLIDKITYLDETTVCGVKNVTINEPLFADHHLGNPVMPEGLQVEAMTQCGHFLLLGLVPDPENYVLSFLELKNIKFKKKIVPGDTLNIRMKLLESVKEGIALTYGEMFVGGVLVMEGEFMAQLAKRSETINNNE